MTTYPKRLTSKILCQLSNPAHDVPFAPMPALFINTATYMSLHKYMQRGMSDFTRCQDRCGSRRNGRSEGKVAGHRRSGTRCYAWTGRSKPHLAPGLINSVFQPHNLVDFRHIGRHDQHIRLPELPHELLPQLSQLCLLQIRDGDFEAQPSGRTISAAADARCA